MNRRSTYALGALAALAIAGTVTTGCSGSHTVTVTKTVTAVKTRDVPVPGETKTVTRQVAVPGPTVTAIKDVPAPPPPQGSVVNTFSGSGNQATPAFNVPDSGDYLVIWSYSGNVDTSFGDSQATNFAITETGSGEALGLPNDIAASGSGSTEVTGASSTDRLNVQAAGHWTITIKSA